MNDYMVLMHAARKTEGKHEQENHNNSYCQYTSKSSVFNEVTLGYEGNTNPDPEAPPWVSWAKWIEIQQKFDSLMATVKGAQNTLQKPHDRDQIRVRGITIKTPITMARGSNGKIVTEIMQPEIIKIRTEGEMIKTKSNTINVRVGGICNTSAPAPGMQGL